jgi:hypothetical protein
MVSGWMRLNGLKPSRLKWCSAPMGRLPIIPSILVTLPVRLGGGIVGPGSFSGRLRSHAMAGEYVGLSLRSLVIMGDYGAGPLIMCGFAVVFGVELGI